MEHYDLILVAGYFRRLTYYLSIVKYLAGRYKIGILEIPIDEYLYEKHRTTQQAFVDTCVRFGARRVGSPPVSAKVLWVPQQPYRPEAYEIMENRVRAGRRVAGMGFAWAGCHDEFIERLGIGKLYIIQRSFFDFLLRERGKERYLDGKETAEIGLPFRKYPIFEDFETDYLLAMPTPFSFTAERDRWLFLETAIQLLDRIGPDARVAHKPHNAVDYDYFSGRTFRNVARWFRWMPFAMRRALFRALAGFPAEPLRTGFGRLYTEILYQRALERTTPLDQLSEHHLLAMEAFLPGVKKGVIGGLSNTMWGALFFQLPFYNCVDLESQDRGSADAHKNDSSKLLDLNLRFFYVPYCGGELNFDPKRFGIVDDSTRSGDLIAELRREMDAAPDPDREPAAHREEANP